MHNLWLFSIFYNLIIIFICIIILFFFLNGFSCQMIGLWPLRRWKTWCLSLSRDRWKHALLVWCLTYMPRVSWLVHKLEVWTADQRGLHLIYFGRRDTSIVSSIVDRSLCRVCFNLPSLVKPRLRGRLSIGTYYWTLVQCFWTLIHHPLLLKSISFLFKFICKLVGHNNQLRIWTQTLI